VKNVCDCFSRLKNLPVLASGHRVASVFALAANPSCAELLRDPTLNQQPIEIDFIRQKEMILEGPAHASDLFSLSILVAKSGV
jgi:hypothetical protein